MMDRERWKNDAVEVDTVVDGRGHAGNLKNEDEERLISSCKKSRFSSSFVLKGSLLMYSLTLQSTFVPKQSRRSEKKIHRSETWLKEDCV